jgi:hypothetical protein
MVGSAYLWRLHLGLVRFVDSSHCVSGQATGTDSIQDHSRASFSLRYRPAPASRASCQLLVRCNGVIPDDVAPFLAICDRLGRCRISNPLARASYCSALYPVVICRPLPPWLCPLRRLSAPLWPAGPLVWRVLTAVVLKVVGRTAVLSGYVKPGGLVRCARRLSRHHQSYNHS